MKKFILLNLGSFLLLTPSTVATPVLNPDVLSCDNPIVTRIEKVTKTNSKGETTETFLEGWECPDNTDFSRNDVDCVLTVETQEYSTLTRVEKKILQCANPIPKSAYSLEQESLIGYEKILETNTKKLLFNTNQKQNIDD